MILVSMWCPLFHRQINPKVKEEERGTKELVPVLKRFLEERVVMVDNLSPQILIKKKKETVLQIWEKVYTVEPIDMYMYMYISLY